MTVSGRTESGDLTQQLCPIKLADSFELVMETANLIAPQS